MSEVVKAAKVFDLWYGFSHKGKSYAMVQLIKRLYSLTKKKSRIYIGDGGVETYYNSGLIEAGILELVEYQDRDYPFSVIDAMVDLWMPENPADPKSKWLPPPKDNLASTHALVAFEGLAVMGKYLHGNIKGGLAYRHARGERIGKDVSKDEPLLIVDETLPGFSEAKKFGGTTVGHYMMSQPFLLSALRRSRKFPGWVIWTSHPVEAADVTEGAKAGEFGKISGKKIVGPELIGKAYTPHLSREFGNTLHFDTATVVEKESDDVTKKQVGNISREYRIYTASHYDPDGNDVIEYLAGNRSSVPAMMPDYLTNKDGGIVRFYEILKEAKDAELKALLDN